MINRSFGRGELVHFENVPCKLGLLDDKLRTLPLPLQDSRIDWTPSAVQILDARTFELTGAKLEAWLVGIYVDGRILFVLPIIGAPVTSGSLIVG